MAQSAKRNQLSSNSAVIAMAPTGPVHFSRLGILMRSTYFGFSIIALTLLVGCTKEGPSIVGTWKVEPPSQPATLVASPDHSFILKGLTRADEVAGRWESEGTTVRFFQDLRDGGHSHFGDGGDGSSDYTISADRKTLTSLSTKGMIMKKLP